MGGPGSGPRKGLARHLARKASYQKAQSVKSAAFNK